MCHPSLRPLLLALPLLLVACSDSKVASYRIPKEPDAPVAEAAPASTPPASQPATGGMAGTTVAKADGPGLTWTAPERWQSKAASAMRKATYVVPGAAGESAELAITAFPGDVGGELANVNRWRGQMELAPIAEAELPGALTRIEANGLHIAVVDLLSSQAGAASRMIGAMVPNAGATWFFKLTGPDALVAQEKPAFLAFLQSLKADAGAAPAPATAPAVSLPPVPPLASAAAPAADMANTAVIKAQGADLKWTAPAGWQSKPASAMRKATYTVAGDGGASAELSITAFPGDVGGELANVNRWRGQLGLAPLADAELAGAVTRLTANSLKVAMVDLSGAGADQQPQRLLGAMVPYAGATWFFKFTGPPALLGKEKASFLAFVQSLQAP